MKKALIILVLVVVMLPALAQSTITVISPNGGEMWVTGCPAVITWSSTAATMPVKVELFKDNIFYMTIANQVGQGSFTWIVPANVVPGANFKVKVSALANTAMFDFSDNPFAISAGNITVGAPNGGETWVKGTMHPILWVDNICANVRIELWKGGVFHSVIATSVPSSGSFNWNIPNVNTLVPGNDYKIKIMGISNTGSTTSLAFDFSDNNFSILEGQNTPVVTLITPNGGENWVMGCPAVIQWMSNMAVMPPVKLELFKNDLFLMTICPQVPAGMNNFTWVPPFSLTPGNTFKVKVSVITSTLPVFDFSNNNFSIGLGNITVGSPNGGETWVKGTMHPILWTHNICSNVRIELWKGGVFNMVIATSVPSNGSFQWMIPNTATLVPGNDYKIKILSLSGNTGSTLQVFDFSDNNFTILEGQNNTAVVLVTPNGGETWIAGCQNMIQWITTAAPAPSVKLELFRNDQFNMTICPQVPAGQTMFNWIPPFTLLPGNNYKVKVTLLTPSGGYDFSNNNFSISGGMINVVSPNGGETFVKGSTHPIIWNDNICQNVRIELWKGNVFNRLIAQSVPSTGTFLWMVPNINTLLPGNDYKVKVMSTANATSSAGIVFDFSNNFFTIAAGPGASIIPESDISVHPNPFADRLRVTFTAAIEGDLVFDLIDNTGNKLLEQQEKDIAAGGTCEIDTRGIQPGKYLLVVRQGARIISRHHVLLVR